MDLSNVNITLPKGGEAAARVFYQDLLGLPEIPKPESLRGRGGVWFSAGGSDLHLSVEENRLLPDACLYFGLECADIPELRARLTEAGVKTEDGCPVLWQRFFVSDPLGNRIEIHEAGAFRV